MKSLAALESRSAVNDVLQQADPEVWQAIDDERRRQQQGLEMIASENYTSPAVMAAQGSVLTNKYAEGYPGRRYYGARGTRSEEHTSELQSQSNLVCRLLLEKKKQKT